MAKKLDEKTVENLKEQYVNNIVEQGREDLLNDKEKELKEQQDAKDLAVVLEFFRHGYLIHNPFAANIFGSENTFSANYDKWKINPHLYKRAIA